MTPEQHVQRVRQVALQLERADFGMGMPRDYELVLRLRSHLDQVTTEALQAIHDAFVGGSLKFLDAVVAVESLGEEEAERVVDEWADAAQAGDERGCRYDEQCGGY